EHPRLGRALGEELRTGDGARAGLVVEGDIALAWPERQGLLGKRKAAVGGPEHKRLARAPVRIVEIWVVLEEAGLRVIGDVNVPVGRDRRVRGPDNALHGIVGKLPRR